MRAAALRPAVRVLDRATRREPCKALITGRDRGTEGRRQAARRQLGNLTASAFTEHPSTRLTDLWTLRDNCNRRVAGVASNEGQTEAGP